MTVSYGIFVHYFIFMGTDYIKKKFSTLALEVKFFLERLNRIDIPTTNRIYETMKKMDSTRIKCFKKNMCASL